MGYLSENKKVFKDIIDVVSEKTRLETAVVEKDYYVTMILKELAKRFDFCVFKGGTSLQKCHKVISRFSEDIDITIDSTLSQGQKKKLKSGIVEIASELGMNIPNIDDTRSRRDYNRYVLAYDAVTSLSDDLLQPAVLLETSYAEISFPTVLLPVHSYIGDYFAEKAPEMLD